MNDLVDKVVEKYSETLMKWFPLQSIFALLISSVIFYLTQTGAYSSTLNSLLHLPLSKFFGEDSIFLRMQVGTVCFSVIIILISNMLQRKTVEGINRFLVKGYGIDKLADALHQKSQQLQLPENVSTQLIIELEKKLHKKLGTLLQISSLAGLIFIFAIVCVIASFLGGDVCDAIAGALLGLSWLWMRWHLVTRFIIEILPIEAHLSGIRRLPYDLAIQL